jgi:tRNA G10  N-methylase Trm11
MTRFFYFLGRTPQLSTAELRVFYPDLKVIQPQICLVENGNPVSDMLRLGGTVKIAEIIEEGSRPDYASVLEVLKSGGGPGIFGFSWYGMEPNLDRSDMARLKDDLMKLGISAGYVLPRAGNQLGTVAVQKKKVTEVNVIRNQDIYFIALTRATQPFEDWIKRDYSRPWADPKHGMLPPKVARMVVNLALGKDGAGKALYDPFCGTGTVLAEAMSIGAIVSGSDISESAVDKAQKNLNWLSQQDSSFKENVGTITTHDAVHLSEIIGPESLDAIVTEPYLGTPQLGEKKVSLEKSRDIMKGLEKLYIGCLRNWSALLKPGGKVCIAFPKFSVHGSVLRVKKPIDTCENLGYTCEQGPIVYGRDNASVAREFYLFRKK